jgi:type VI secretion system protein ImpH
LVQSERRDLAMAYAGVFGRRIKGATALAGVLRDRLGVAARIEEFVPCWVETGPVSSLGRHGMTLGDDAVLGERVLDVGRKINIRLGPLCEECLLGLLPRGTGAEDFRDIVNGYLEPTLEYDVIFDLESAASERRLGCDPNYLGWNSPLGRSAVKRRRIRLAGSAYKR